MPLSSWDVTVNVNVAGVGSRVIVRVVQALTLEDAIVEARRDLVTTTLVRAVPSGT